MDRRHLKRSRRCIGLCVVIMAVMTVFAAGAFAADAPVVEHEAEAAGSSDGLVALAAALSIGIAAIATGIAQARIGAAGIGAIAENPKRLGAVIMLVAIPETVAILGFVIAYLIIK